VGRSNDRFADFQAPAGGVAEMTQTGTRPRGGAAAAGGEQEPAEAARLHDLGVALLRAKKHREAADSFRRALQLRPESPHSLANLGVALAEQGGLDEAIVHFQNALELNPGALELHGNLGLASFQKGEFEGAAASFQQAVQLNPGSADAHDRLGVALARFGRFTDAVVHCRRACELEADSAQFRIHLANALRAAGRLDEAVAAYGVALRRRPDLAEGHGNLGIALEAQGKYREAVASLRHSLRLNSESAETWSNLGVLLAEVGRCEEAVECHRRSLALKPDCAESHNNLGVALVQQGQLAEAVESYERALLAQEEFRLGWAEYEWRWRCKGFSPRSFRAPAWDGTELGGRTILLYCEQGLGDAVQLVRYAALVQARGGRVLLECPRALLPLLRTCPGIDRLVAHGEPLPPFDVHAALMSLPRLLGTTLDTIPARVPYLSARPDLVERWGAELAKYPGFKIGINWQGNPRYALGEADPLLTEDPCYAELSPDAGRRRQLWQEFLRGEDPREDAVRRGDWAVGDDGFRGRMAQVLGRPLPRPRGRPAKSAKAGPVQL